MTVRSFVLEPGSASFFVEASDAKSGVHRLTSAIARGDADAFAEFYEAWFDRAYAIARSLTRRDESFCLDVVQDAMLRVVRSLQPMKDAAALSSWMSRVVHTTALDRLRQEARRSRREGHASARRRIDAPPGDSSASLELEEQVAWLEARLREIPDEDRALLAERFEGGKTLRDAGAAIGITGNAANSRIRRALSRLRSMAREVFRE